MSDHQHHRSIPTVQSKRTAVRNCQWMLLFACLLLVLAGWFWPAALALMLSLGFSLGMWVQRWVIKEAPVLLKHGSGKHIG